MFRGSRGGYVSAVCDANGVIYRNLFQHWNVLASTIPSRIILVYGRCCCKTRVATILIMTILCHMSRYIAIFTFP